MRQNSKHWILLPVLAIVVLCTALTACGNTSPRNLMESIESGSVILGTKFDQPGLGLRHPDKSFTGFDVAVSEVYAARSGQSATFSNRAAVPMPPAELIMASSRLPSGRSRARASSRTTETAPEAP